MKVKDLLQQLEHCNPDDEVRISPDYWEDKRRMRKADSTLDNVYPVANVIIQGDHPGNTIITHYED